jgi:protein-disulfide isomerase/uncharacterized membrane protein
MDEKKSLTLNGMTIPNSINILCSLGIIGITIYLSSYFFDVHFQGGLNKSSTLCDISSFFTCSGATLSPASNILGVPVAFFGLIVGISFLMGSIFPSEDMEKTNAFIARINLPGILFFLLYSIISLGTLCPMCTVYYILSGLVAFLYWKYSDADWTRPNLKIMAVWVVLTLIGSFAFNNHYSNEKAKQNLIVTQIVDQYNELDDLGAPKVVSPYDIYKSTDKFEDAPIQMILFSDFECPFCGMVSKQIHKMLIDPIFKKKYAGKINIKYYFYPLDDACNPGIKRKFHEYACKAAMIAGCDASKFAKVHDHIFNNQDDLDDDFLKETANKFGLKDCFKNKSTAAFIGKAIQQGDEYNVNSTPTSLVNNKKIEGTIPNKQFYAIFDDILKKANK